MASFTESGTKILGFNLDRYSKFTEPFEKTSYERHSEEVESWSTRRLRGIQSRRMETLTRTAMGEYIPPAENEVLTVAAMPTPSAFDYRPNYNSMFRSSPKITIGRKITVKKDIIPGPQDYRILKRKCPTDKAPTIKVRHGFAYLPKVNKNQKATASSYKLSSRIGKDSARAVITSRPPIGVNVGMLPSFPYPQAGFGSKVGFYSSRVKTKEKKGYSFGKALQSIQKEDVPGPIYDIPSKFPEGRQCSIKGKIDWPVNGKDIPAPNSYFPRSALGKGGMYPRVTNRLPSTIKGKKFGPGPNAYSIGPPSPRPLTMGTIPLPSRFPRQPYPEPATYTIEQITRKLRRRKKIKARPRETIMKRRRTAIDPPRPSSLDLNYFKFEKFGKGAPAATIRSRAKVPIDNKLAPNKYHCPSPNVFKRKAPSYSFGRRPELDKTSTTMDAPLLRLASTIDIKRKFTFGLPFKETASKVPPPTKYTTESKGKCRVGISFKARPSPFVHHGIASVKIPVTPTNVKMRKRRRGMTA